MQAGQDERARALADRLRAEGHGEAAARVEAAVGSPTLGSAVRHTLDDVCQWLLTAVEALDPKTAAMAEELRLEVDKRLL